MRLPEASYPLRPTWSLHFGYLIRSVSNEKKNPFQPATTLRGSAFLSLACFSRGSEYPDDYFSSLWFLF